jgi:hypothetical protein
MMPATVAGGGVAAEAGSPPGVTGSGSEPLVAGGGSSVPTTTSPPPSVPVAGGPLVSPPSGGGVVPVPWPPPRPGSLWPRCDPPRWRSEPRRLRRPDEGFGRLDAVADPALLPVEAGVVDVAGVVFRAAEAGVSVVLGLRVAEPARDCLEVLLDRDDEALPPRRRAVRPLVRVLSGFVADGLPAGLVAGLVSGSAAGVSVADAAGCVVAAGVAVSEPVLELGAVPGEPDDDGVAGSGVAASSGVGAVVDGASALPVAVPPPGPLLSLDVVEPGVAGVSDPGVAAAMLAVLRLARAIAKTVPMTTRPNPRRWPLEPPGRWRPTLRLLVVDRVTSSRASRRPKIDRPSKSNPTGCPVGNLCSVVRHSVRRLITSVRHVPRFFLKIR